MIGRARRTAVLRTGSLLACVTVLLGHSAARAQVLPPPSWANGGLELRSTSYPAVTFIIPRDELVAYDRARALPSNLLWDGRPTPQEILVELDKRFNEAAVRYSANKDRLPSCLKDALDRLYERLSTTQGPLYIVWQREIGLEWPALPGSAGAGGQNGPHFIRVVNAYAVTNACRDGNGLTAGLLFHEVVHLAKDVYPDCFQSLSKAKNETSTEDATVRLFNPDKVCTPYKNQGLRVHHATYKNICECKPGCPLQ